jgi:signal transduction histidine kinase
MVTTLLMKQSGSPGREAAGKALRDAGVGVVEVQDWSQVAEELLKCEAVVAVCDADLDSAGAIRLTRALASLPNKNESAPQALASEAARALSHDMRTPLSAMAGWVHLIESGKLDEAGLKRAASKLRGNIDDQVRMIERYLGATSQEGRQ